MRLNRSLAALAAALVVGGLTAEVRAQQATVTPNVNVQQVPGGQVVTPSVSTSIPLGSGGATLNGNVQVPIVVPQGGRPVVTPPSVNVGVTIPLGKR